MSEPLYNSEILRLATATAGFARLSEAGGTAEKRSPVCGSRVTVDVILDHARAVASVGIEARACALGQAATALMAENATGKTLAEIESARDGLSAYLAGDREDPGSWPGLEIFAPARKHRARHASILLAFEAAAEAVQLAQSK
jgi:NifU-like protein involved in Fe-S cluster formation